MSEEKTYIKGLNFLLASMGADACAVDVKNGKAVRIRPLHYDWKYEPEEVTPWTIEARGKVFKPLMKVLVPPFSLAFKKRVYSPNRVMYPLKRVDWDPKGERHPENRGKSGFVRISWDEALEIIAGEIKRVIAKYGPYSILSQSDGHEPSKVVHEAHGCSAGLLRLLGGFTLQVRNPDSWEGWYWGAKHVWGCESCGMQLPQSNVLPDILEHSELLLFWGCDWETTTWGFGDQSRSRWCYWFKELGLKSIYISPDLNYAAAIHADKWIPIRPNTDAALQLAIAYVWITEGTYDKDYVATHTVGFDKFRPYVLGEEDGVPKTPKWAEEITGVPARIIKALAREWASKTTSLMHYFGGPYVRGPYSTEPARLEVLLLAMQGLGKPGVQQFHAAFSGEIRYFPTRRMVLGTVQPRPSLFINLSRACRGHTGGTHDIEARVKDYPEYRQFIPKTLVPDAILNPPISWYGTSGIGMPAEDQFNKYTFPAKGYPELHMIWTDNNCWTTCWNCGNRMVEAFRSPKIEFILAEHPWLENDGLYADIVLPVTTKFEEEDIGATNPVGDPQFHMLHYEGKCIEPVGESKSDYEISCLVAEKLGLLEKYTEGRTIKEWIKYGFETSGVQNLVSYEKFMEKEYYIIPFDPDWKKLKPGLRQFYETPAEAPLQTPSGKIEFYSERLAKHFPDDDERPAVPHWIPYGESHQETLVHPKAKKYPFLLMSNHPKWRMHAMLDDITWFHEIPTCKVKGPDGYLYEPAWINPADAAKLSIANGDVVKLYNDRGAILCGAYVTERIMPGVVYVDHGSRADPIVPGELDRGGAIDLIAPNKTSKNAPIMVVSGYLVGVERADLEELRRKYPEAFKRPFHPTAGVCYESWVKEG